MVILLFTLKNNRRHVVLRIDLGVKVAVRSYGTVVQLRLMLA